MKVAGRWFVAAGVSGGLMVGLLFYLAHLLRPLTLVSVKPTSPPHRLQLSEYPVHSPPHPVASAKAAPQGVASPKKTTPIVLPASRGVGSPSSKASISSALAAFEFGTEQGPGFAPSHLAKAWNPLAAAQQPALPLARPAPTYPFAARLQGQEGRVVISFSIDHRGHPQDLRIDSASPPGVFEQAALRALKSWRYQPRRQGGESVADHRRRVVEIPFKLRTGGDSHAP